GAARPVVGAGGGADDLAAHEQVDAGEARELAAADEEAEELALDGELRRGEPSGAAVAAGEAVDEPLAEETLDRHLAGQRPLRGALAERAALDLPVAVGVALEVRDEQVGPVAGQGEGGEEQQDGERVAHGDDPFSKI